MNKSVHINYEQSIQGGRDHTLRRGALLKVIDTVFKDVPNNEVSIFDMGCGRGELLRALVERGYKAQGMDFDPQCVEIASKHAPVAVGDYASVTQHYDPGSFDLVVSSHSLEHLLHPVEDMRGLVSISSKYVLVAVPNPLALHNILRSFSRSISGVNKGHVASWDHKHLKNFLETFCELRTLSWSGDYVRVVPRRFGIRQVVWRSNIIPILEGGILAKVIPFNANSIIVLCDRRDG